MNGVERIAAERQRQIDAEGWTPDHDDCHDDDELAFAAAAYAVGPTIVCDYKHWTELWPWPLDEFNERGDRVQHLARAGALIAAEIDRIQRLEV